MKRLWIVLAILAAFSAVGLMALFSAVNRLDELVVTDGGILYWIVDGAYEEQRDDSPLAMVMSEQGPTQAEMLAALSRAARDPDIEGLFLEIHSLPAALAEVQELRDAVAEVRDAGKPVHAWLSTGSNREYLLALAADSITLAPEGHLVVTGLSAELTFLAGTLDKLGMEADFVSVGRFKSAPESYERTEASAPHLEMIDALLDDQYAWMLGSVAEARGLDSDAVAAAVDVGFHDARGAMDAGLVDALDYQPETLDAFFPDGGTVDLELYAYGGGGRRSAASVALIHVGGTIVDGESSPGGWQGRSAGSWTVCERLQEAYEDDDVDAVVLRVDSPGGSALASDLIWNEVVALTEIKPVVVSMGGVAASGGYYVSAAADSVFASPGTITGSIGVFSGKISREEFYGKLGISRQFRTRGDNALILADREPFTAAQRTLLEHQLGSFYERFVAKVAEGRALEPAAAAAAAEGRVWTGSQALEAGLVDGIGGLPRALDSVRAMLGLTDADALTLYTFERSPTFLERLLVRSLRETRGPAMELAAPVAEAAAFGAQVELLDGRPLALQPFGIDLR